MILDDILAYKQEEVTARKHATPASALRERALYHEPRRGFRAALAAHPAPAVIAELKRASPSKGVIRTHYDPPAHARAYEAAGATALSVLTDERFFEGHLDHLATVRATVGLPCLRKDFLVDPYQVDEARAYGADAVLVIAATGSGTLRVELLAATPDPYSEIRGCSCLIMPSRYEGLPMVALEALAIGRPVLGSDVDGLRDLIEPGVNGMLFPREDPQGLSATLASFCENPELAERMAQDAPQSVRRFGRDAIARAWLSLADSICAHRQ